jgi:hypothetical protein
LPKSIQATVTLLENLSLVLDKCHGDEGVKAEALPMLFNALDSSTAQVQVKTTLSLSPLSNTSIEHIEHIEHD